MTSRPQREKGMNEPTDTYVWGAVVDNGLDPRDVLLWNIFPFHPYKASPFSNRTPTDSELAEGSYTPKPCCSTASRYPPGSHRQEIGRNPAKCRLPGPGHAPSGKRWCQPLPGTVRTFFPIIPLKNRLNSIFTLNLSAFLRKHARKSLHRLHKLFIIIGTPQYIRAFSLIQ